MHVLDAVAPPGYDSRRPEGFRRAPRIVASRPSWVTAKRERGSSSVVEHRLAKARVASSNLVFRSKTRLTRRVFSL